MQRYFKIDAQEGLPEKAQSGVFMYSAVAVVIFYILNLYVPKLPCRWSRSSGTPSSLTRCSSSFIARHKEQFFRGFLANLLITSSRLGILMDTLIFMVYHFTVYGNSPSDLGIIFRGWSDLGLHRLPDGEGLTKYNDPCHQ